ncbi:MAG: DUF1365 domain-containing protein [Beijerinckiaceae bacterium]
MNTGQTPHTPFSPPADGAGWLYDCVVGHARLKPVGHRFRYHVYNLLIDLDRLDAADRSSGLFSVGSFNLLSFNAKDHGSRDGQPLREWADGLFAQAGLDTTGGRMLLLCYPRVLGLVFDPLSIYYAYDNHGQLRGVIYEVRNTFGEHHSYVAPVQDGEMSQAGLKQSRTKQFYVSPFNDLAMRYLFRLRPPTESLNVRILEVDQDGPLLSATVSGTKSALSTKNILKAFFLVPLLPFKVVIGIHWEAVRLFIKGLRMQPKPPAPPVFSLTDPDQDQHHQGIS